VFSSGQENNKFVFQFLIFLKKILLPMTSKQNKPHHNGIITGSTIAVALSKVSSGGRAVGTHRGVHRRQRIN